MVDGNSTKHRATRQTKSGIRVVAITTTYEDSHSHDVYIEAAGVYYSSAQAIRGLGGDARAVAQARDAATYLDSLTRPEIETLKADGLMHPDLADRLLTVVR